MKKDKPKKQKINPHQKEWPRSELFAPFAPLKKLSKKEQARRQIAEIEEAVPQQSLQLSNPFTDSQRAAICTEIINSFMTFCHFCQTKNLFQLSSEADIKKDYNKLKLRIQHINKLLTLLIPEEVKGKKTKSQFVRICEQVPGCLIYEILEMKKIFRPKYYRPPYRGKVGEEKRKRDVEEFWEKELKPQAEFKELKTIHYGSEDRIILSLIASMQDCRYRDLLDIYTKFKRTKNTGIRRHYKSVSD